ncbi:MAG TPA: hypothetical protein VD993_14270 [Chitinophagaceae bacterium]|nr:hypothetical protein [Chitinophagaceae bacterium]
MLLNSRKGKEAKKYVERKLLRRLRIFFVVFILLMGVIIYEIVYQHLEAAACVGAMMMGMLVGAVFVRRKRIYWEEETSQVIARMDKIGIALLVVYILFAVARHWFLHQWLTGNRLTAFSFSLAAGAMLGRLLSIRSQIRQILKERSII